MIGVSYSGSSAVGQGGKNRAPNRLFLVRILLAGLIACILLACSNGSPPLQEHESFTFGARRWHEAEQPFRQDKHWLGGDGAYSLDLKSGRVLWIFGDSFIGKGESRKREDASLVRNSIAIQKGYDPSDAAITFHWGIKDGMAEAFFPSSRSSWYWPGSGVIVLNRLVIFLMEIEPSEGGFGFAVKGWGAVGIDNPGEEPALWKKRRLRTPENNFNVIIGSACSFVSDGYLYAFGAHALDHGAYAVRWSITDAARGNLMNPQWWTGEAGWVSQDKLKHKPEPLFPEAQMEYTVHYEPLLGRFLQVQTESITGHCIVYRWAKALAGPWSEKRQLYCPSDTETKDLLVYAGKAHPVLKGADLICTYALNTLDLKRLLDDDSLYYPVFMKTDIQKIQGYH